MEGSIKIFNEGRRPVGTLVLSHPSLCGMENLYSCSRNSSNWLNLTFIMTLTRGYSRCGTQGTVVVTSTEGINVLSINYSPAKMTLFRGCSGMQGDAQQPTVHLLAIT